jgi:hypothetical protein
MGVLLGGTLPLARDIEAVRCEVDLQVIVDVGYVRCVLVNSPQVEATMFAADEGTSDLLKMSLFRNAQMVW